MISLIALVVSSYVSPPRPSPTCSFLKNELDLKSSLFVTSTPFFTFFAYASHARRAPTFSDSFTLRFSRMRFAFSSYAARSISSFSSRTFFACRFSFFALRSRSRSSLSFSLSPFSPLPAPL